MAEVFSDSGSVSRNDKKVEKHVLISLAKRFGGYPMLAGLGVCSLLRTARDIGCAVTLAMVTNAVMMGGRVWYCILLAMTAMFANIPINMGYNYLSERYTAHVRDEAMRAMGEKLPKLPASWLDAKRTGELISTCTTDIDLFLKWIRFGGLGLLQQGAYYIAAIVYALSQNVSLTVLAFPVVVVLVPLFARVARPLQDMMAAQRKQASNAMSQTQEVLADLEQLKAYSLEEVMEQRVELALTEQMEAQQKSGIYQGISQSIGNLSSYLPGFVAAAAGVVFLMRGEVTVGFLVSFVQMAVQRFSELIPGMAQVAALTRQAEAAAARVNLFLEAPSEREDGETEVPLDWKAPVFEAENLTFGYDGQEKVLENVSFTVERGKTTAFVGPSGSGKSTILSLLMGVYQPDCGKLSFMGRAVSKWNLQALRKQIAPVFQDTFLFPATVAENLCGSRIYEEDRIWEVLEKAGLSDKVKQLPEGIRTLVGEWGATLSGGQRQRMTIARAFYKDAPVLLLDEPTSALDTVTEDQLQQSFDELKQGRTAVVVAHRLKTIRDADYIYVLEKGKIVQQGTHEELFAIPGVYRRLYEAQALEGMK